MGAEAVRILLEPEGLSASQLVGLFDDQIVIQPLDKLLKENEEILAAFSAKTFNGERILQLRGLSTWHGWHAYCMLQALPGEKPSWPTDPKMLTTRPQKIAIMHIGAPSPGMNTVVRALVRMCLAKGHRVWGIHEGVLGLLAKNINEMHFVDVGGWSSLGGAVLGTSRYLPTEKELATIKHSLVQEYQIDTLVVIGGYEGYRFANVANKDALGIPVVVIPATVSNNCPGTEFSVGCDRGVTNLMESVDKIKQSAISSKRVYFIESIGGNCGYLVTFTSRRPLSFLKLVFISTDSDGCTLFRSRTLPCQRGANRCQINQK